MTIERTTVKQADLTVLICTLDRPDSLRETLQLLAQNDIDRLDVLVIDNANEPTARAVTESMSAELSVRYLHEPKAGKGHALNRGLEAECLAPIIAVLDDDMSPGPEWCRGVLDLCERWPDSGVFAAGSYVVWPENIEIPEWVRRGAVSCWALSVVRYDKERYTAPGEFMSGNHFWFRRDIVGSRRFPDFWAPEAHFTLGLIDDGTTGVVAPEPRCGHRIQPNLLCIDVQRERATKMGRHLARFRLEFPRTVPQAKMAANHPLLWKVRCLANLARWLLVAASVPLRRSGNRIPTALVARVAIANNLECLRRGSLSMGRGLAPPRPEVLSDNLE